MLRIRAPLLRILQNSEHKFHFTQRNAKATSARQNAKSAEQTAVDTSRSDEAAATTSTATGKLPARMPLVKNFFAGVVDKELLAYPEVIARDDLVKLQNELLPLKNFFESEEEPATKPKAAAQVEGARQLGLYGVNVPREYDGKNWGWSESLMASEPETSSELALALLSHRVVVDALREIGTEEQKQRYLPNLSTGAIVATEAVYEYEAPEYDFFNTTAEYCHDIQAWQLNGEKAFVIAGPLPSADTKQLFLVIAQTAKDNMRGDAKRSTTLFLVDSTMPGVQLGEEHTTFGYRDVCMRRVRFDQVRLPEDSVLGMPNEGNAVAEVLLRGQRLRSALIGFGHNKQTLKQLTQHCIDSRQCGAELRNMENIQAHLSKATCALYAMESMIYMTAGLLDEFHRQDVILESAITKYYTMREVFELATRSLDIIGPKALHSGHSAELTFRNAAQLYTQSETIDSMALFIAIGGLQHAGALLGDTVRKSRNPLLHPGHIFTKFMQGSNIDQPKTKMLLGERLHPSLAAPAQCIEHSVARLHMCVELVLTRYGSEVIEEHNELRRLADMAAALYAMYASTARASRSYCIGLPLADHELLLASAICSEGSELVKSLATEVFHGRYINNDNNLRRLSKQVFKSKGHFAVHPMSYNY